MSRLWNCLSLLVVFAAFACGGGSAVVGGDARADGRDVSTNDAVSDIGPTCPAGETVCAGRCVDTQTDRTHCGTCGNACPTGQVCVMGRCEISCPMGQTVCDGRCVDTQTDRAHCGACGRACARGQVCSMGICALECGPMLATCGGMDAGTGEPGSEQRYCTNLQTDRMNCGACGNVCPSGQICVMGRCEVSCPMGQTVCDGRCVDTQTDRAHCGGCGNVCPSGQICVMGRCEVSCPMGQTVCDGRCVDTQTDRAHCGRCGNACPAGQVCSAGVCEVSCGAGLTNCSGTCRDLNNDRLNCGACGNACPSGQICSAGACVVSCPAGQTDCSGMCVNLTTDPAHCGRCGNGCSTGPNATATCAAGRCTLTCATGFADCNGVATDGCEVNVSSDRANCGACGRACPAEQTCIAGTCTPVRTCFELHRMAPSLPSGVYTIDPDGSGPLAPVQTYCEMTTRGGGWTLVQRSVLDWGMTRSLFTTLDVFRSTTIGNPRPGSVFRMAARYWPLLQTTGEHLMIHTPARTDNTGCGPLYYIAPSGWWSVPATGNITLRDVVEPGGGVIFFNNRAAAGISAIDVDNDTSPPGQDCVEYHQAAPWFYEYCCWTCPSFGRNYWGWPANPPRPMANYLHVPDIHGQTVSTVCAGGAPVQTSGGYYGELSMEYLLR